MIYYGKKTQAFFDLIFDESRVKMLPKSSKSNKELGKVLKNILFDLNGPRIVKEKHAPVDLFFANKIFRPLSEIIYSVEAIHNISIYIKRFPYREQEISKLSYLKYHIENYLNEIYILKERLISYLRIVERGYKKSKDTHTIKKTTKTLETIVERAFKSYLSVRGRHIHVNRYSDTGIEHLSALELFSREPKDKMSVFMNRFFQSKYRQVRKNWQKKISEDLKSIHALLDNYFGILQTVISIDGKINYPKQIRRV